MKKTLRQSIVNYHMPMYMCEILVNNYCPCFLSMTIVKENNSYMFSYDTGYSNRIDFAKLDTLDKLILLRSIMKLNSMSEDWLIKADTYLLEPELLYSYNNSVYSDEMKLLFYPDFNKVSFGTKLLSFIDKIKDPRNKRECELMEQLKRAVVEGDFNKFDRLAEKQIGRIRAESAGKVG